MNSAPAVLAHRSNRGKQLKPVGKTSKLSLLFFQSGSCFRDQALPAKKSNNLSQHCFGKGASPKPTRQMAFFCGPVWLICWTYFALRRVASSSLLCHCPRDVLHIQIPRDGHGLKGSFISIQYSSSLAIGGCEVRCYTQKLPTKSLTRANLHTVAASRLTQWPSTPVWRFHK